MYQTSVRDIAARPEFLRLACHLSG